MRRYLPFLSVALLAIPGLIWAAQDGVLLVDDFEGDGPKLGSSWEMYADTNDLGTKANPFTIEKGGPKTTKGFGRLSGHLGKNKDPWPWVVAQLDFNNDGPKDLSGYKAIQFYAKGDGKKHRVSVMREAVGDYCHYDFTFVAPKEWTLIVVPLDEFTQPNWGKQVGKSWKDVTGIRFLALNAGDDEDFDLCFDDVAFVKTSKTTPQAAPTEGALIVDDFAGSSPKLGGSWQKYTDDKDLGTKATFNVEKGPKASPGFAHFYGHLGKQKAPWPYAIMELSFNEDGPKDLATYKALTFYARGDGKKHRVSVNRKAVEDYCNYEFSFVAPKEWTLIVAPLGDFVQPSWGKKVDRSWNDVTGVRFLALDPGDDEDFDFSFDDVAFVKTLPMKK